MASPFYKTRRLRDAKKTNLFGMGSDTAALRHEYEEGTGAGDPSSAVATAKEDGRSPYSKF
jgi:hypothetical protein